MSHNMMTRRSFGKLLSMAALSLPLSPALHVQKAHAAGNERRYLFVLGALGGASITDSFLPVREAATPKGPSINSFADALLVTPPGSALRCVAPLQDEVNQNGLPLRLAYDQASFLRVHKDDLCVMTVEGASVNHSVAQMRSLSGGGINQGRTLLEAVGMTHGQGLVLPVVNMMTGGFGERGRDPGLPLAFQQVSIQDARTFALSTHGQKGLPHEPAPGLLERARGVRDKLEDTSAFGKTFAHTQTRESYLALRRAGLAVESADLVSKLMLLDLPGLPQSQEMPKLVTHFPRLRTDVFEAQAALAYLLVFHGLSCAVGLSPRSAVSLITENGKQIINNPQLAFDYSHNAHRVAQSVMWARLLGVADGLIRLLKETEDPRHKGDSLFQRSLIYLATEFGRDRGRPLGQLRFGTGHHLNNGVVLVSPKLKGNRAFGGVDEETGLTYGFDPQTGAEKRGMVMNEGDVYSAICQAMGVDFPGRRPFPCMMR